MFAYVEYMYPYPFIFHKELLWIDRDCKCYFAFKLTDSDSWTYFAGNPSHTLAPGQYLYPYGLEETAQENYFQTTRSLSGKVFALLPINFQAKYARLYIQSGSNVWVREWYPSVYVTAHDIVSGTLEITDLLSDAPVIRVTKGGLDRIVIGNYYGDRYGLVGYDRFGATVFELSNEVQNISGWDINQEALKRETEYDETSSGLAPADYPFYAGSKYENRATAPFRVAIDGTLYAIGAQISGNISAGTIDIGGMDETSFHVDIDGNMWVGAAEFVNAPFSVNSGGSLYAIDGIIGGNVLGIDFMGSPNFISGYQGSGWKIQSDGNAEFWNVLVRGVFHTSVFEKDTISCVNGILIVSSGDVLAEDMTSSVTCKVVIPGATTFRINEVIRMKDGFDDEWLLVLAVTPTTDTFTYTVTRDLAGTYAPTPGAMFALPSWKKGTAVVSMGLGTTAIITGNGQGTEFVRGDFTDGNAFIDIVNLNLSPYIGSRIVVRDINGRIAEGFLTAGGAGETVGDEIIEDGNFFVVRSASNSPSKSPSKSPSVSPSVSPSA